ncbi:MAG: biotin--[acetyl-CoA-carboxylase] ligase [Rhodospirillales bacterium]|nr:biotin--[acetyl-CoA-carboxylase] ligase [Rhodospirillales bacterium]
MPPSEPTPRAPGASGDLEAQPAPGSPFKLIALDEVDSTSTMAKRLCAADAEDRTLVWALRQTAGRGRLSRTWISPSGNLYVSLILRPEADATRATGLTFAAAVAVADAVAEVLGAQAPVRCKWPNDVLVGGRKVAGILLESSTSAAGLLQWVVIGIGVNVASHPPDTETMYPATSLSAEGAAGVDVERALEVLCRHLDRWLRRWAEEGFPTVRSAWLERAHGLGAAIAVRAGDEAVLRGVFRGLDEDGALILDQAGARRRVTAGDVLPGQAPASPAPSS